jgi:formate dehydrogenase maturation protein FdhE
MNPGSKLPDFDDLVALNQRDPQAFEQLRRQLLDDVVSTAPEHHRPALARVLERIESTRRAAATPMDSAVAASRLMQESLGTLLVCWKQAQFRMSGLQATTLIDRIQRRR